MAIYKYEKEFRILVWSPQTTDIKKGLFVDMATRLQISCAQPSWKNWKETVDLGTNITLDDAVSVGECRALSLKGWPDTSQNLKQASFRKKQNLQ